MEQTPDSHTQLEHIHHVPERWRRSMIQVEILSLETDKPHWKAHIQSLDLELCSTTKMEIRTSI